MSDAPKTQNDSGGCMDAVGYILAGAFAGCIVGVCLMWHRFSDMESMHLAKINILKSEHRSYVTEKVREEVGKIQYQATSRGYAVWSLDYHGIPVFKWIEPKKEE